MSTCGRAPLREYPGVQFAERTAYGGYSRGLSKFHSAALPDGKFNLPRREILEYPVFSRQIEGPLYAFHDSRSIGLSIRNHELLVEDDI